MILGHEQKKHTIEDIQGYLDPDIPYRRGYLLHGLRGTCKSAVCLVLAGLFNLDI
jgi:chaperone BCS1